jgi:hypothetical protein
MHEQGVIAMQKETITVDITNIPDLLRLAEEVKTTRTSRVLKRGDEPVAMLTPMEPTSAAPSVRLLELFDRVAGSLADVDVPGWESSEAAEKWVERSRAGDMFPFEPPTKK